MKYSFIIGVFLLLLNMKTSAEDPRVQKIDELVGKYNSYGLFNGSVLISEGGKIIYNKGIGYANFEWSIPNTPDTKFRLGSVTKQFTAALIMQLVEKGKLNLDTKITEILNDYPQKTGSKITIHHLLTHTSGIPNYTDFPGFMEDSRVRTKYSTEELLKLFCDNELDFEPGTQFSYSNSGYLVLGAIIEKIMHDSYENVLQKNILNPLNMENTRYDHFESLISKRATGYDRTPLGYRNSHFIDMTVPFSAGAIYSTVEDLYKWDQALYSNKILSEESKERMFTPYIAAFGSSYYGYGWGINKAARNAEGDSMKVVAHGGGIFGFNTMIIRQPEVKNLIVILNNTPGANLNELGTSISNILFNLPYKMPKQMAIDAIIKYYYEKGIDGAITYYKELKNSHANEYAFNERNLNELGYELMRSRQLTDALEVFKLAVEEYPNSSNVYDSYGEGLLTIGDTANAITNYKKSVDMNPANQRAIELLKKLNVPVEENELKISPEILSSYTGKYQLSPNMILTVTTEQEKIFVQLTGQPKFEIYPRTETNFYLKVVNAQIDFPKDGNGIVNYLILHQNGQDIKADKL